MTKNLAQTESVEAGTKRSIARRFNDLLAFRGKDIPKTEDKRTVRRLARYKQELQNGKTSQNKVLTPLDVAMRIDELLAFGEKMADLRKLTKPRSADIDFEHLVGILKEMHPVYGYRADAYRFAGVSDQALLAAGIINKIPARRGPKPSTKAEKK